MEQICYGKIIIFLKLQYLVRIVTTTTATTLVEAHEIPVPIRKGRNRYKLQEPGCPEGGPGPYCVPNIFVSLGSVFICPLH